MPRVTPEAKAALEIALSARNRHALNLPDATGIALEQGVRPLLLLPFVSRLTGDEFQAQTGGVKLMEKRVQGFTVFVEDGTDIRETDYDLRRSRE